MEVLPVLSVTELESLTLNDELVEYCQSKPNDTKKIINWVSIKLRNKIDKNIFYEQETEEYNIPEDLKLVWASLCESVYTYSIKEKNNNATGRKISERIDDYSITYAENQSAYTFFWIPTDSDIIAIIEAYSDMSGEGYLNINLH